jgi:hypothetical protein
MNIASSILKDPEMCTLDDLLRGLNYTKNGQLWRAVYTPADRQTSRGVLHHTAQYMYTACI